MPVNEEQGVPLSVTIPIPSHIPRARGVNSTYSYGAVVQVRLHKDEVALIQREADRLGVPRSGFIRWCTLYVAQALAEHNEGTTHDIDT